MVVAVSVNNWYLRSRTSLRDRSSRKVFARRSSLSKPFDFGDVSNRFFAFNNVLSTVSPNVSSTLASTRITTVPSSSSAFTNMSMLAGSPLNSSKLTLASGSADQPFPSSRRIAATRQFRMANGVPFPATGEHSPLRCDRPSSVLDCSGSPGTANPPRSSTVSHPWR